MKPKRGDIGDCLWGDGKHVRIVIIEVKKEKLIAVLLEDINDKYHSGKIIDIAYWQFGPECTLTIEP